MYVFYRNNYWIGHQNFYCNSNNIQKDFKTDCNLEHEHSKLKSTERNHLIHVLNLIYTIEQTIKQENSKASFKINLKEKEDEIANKIIDRSILYTMYGLSPLNIQILFLVMKEIGFRRIINFSKDAFNAILDKIFDLKDYSIVDIEERTQFFTEVYEINKKDTVII